MNQASVTAGDHVDGPPWATMGHHGPLEYDATEWSLVSKCMEYDDWIGKESLHKPTNRRGVQQMSTRVGSLLRAQDSSFAHWQDVMTASDMWLEAEQDREKTELNCSANPFICCPKSSLTQHQDQLINLNHNRTIHHISELSNFVGTVYIWNTGRWRPGYYPKLAPFCLNVRH